LFDFSLSTSLIDAPAPGAISSDIGSASLARGRALLGQGKRMEARAALSSAVEHLTPTLGADHPYTRLAGRLAAADATR